MRLGIVGMLPGDFRTHGDSHFEAIQELGFTGAGFHFPGEKASEISASDIDTCRARFSDHHIDLVQMAVTYKECLFHPREDVRKEVVDKIVDTAEIAAALDAHYFLIRPGSRNPQGSWTPHRENHTADAWSLFTETMGAVTEGLEQHGVVAVMETHLVSILRDPETCRRMLEESGSDALQLVMDYVNHFETLSQVYDSRSRLDHIFDQMGPDGPVLHVKDIALGTSLVVHIEETVPGNGELDLHHCFTRFESLFPDKYGLIEHLPKEKIPEANTNTRQILSEANIQIVS